MRAQPRRPRGAPTGVSNRPLCRVSASVLVIAAFVWPAVPAPAQSLSALEQLEDPASPQSPSNLQSNIAASRDYLENLAANLKTTADGLSTLFDLQNLKPRIKLRRRRFVEDLRRRGRPQLRP